LERCQQICSIFSHRSFRPDLTLTRFTIVSQAASRLPTLEPSVPSTGMLVLVITHNVFPFANSSEVDLTSCDSATTRMDPMTGLLSISNSRYRISILAIGLLEARRAIDIPHNCRTRLTSLGYPTTVPSKVVEVRTCHCQNRT
jgi:hypothetical protein